MPRGGKRPGAGRKKTIGRPTEYKEAFVSQAEKLCQLGATDEELAQFFDVSSKTIYRWACKHEAFGLALKQGKDVADERVVRSLYHRAIGYTHDAVKIFPPRVGQKKELVVPYKEHVPPDTTAAIFWLKNRRAGDWRDKSEIVHRHEATELDDGELADIARTGRNGVAEAPVDPEKLN